MKTYLGGRNLARDLYLDGLADRGCGKLIRGVVGKFLRRGIGMDFPGRGPCFGLGKGCWGFCRVLVGVAVLKE